LDKWLFCFKRFGHYFTTLTAKTIDYLITNYAMLQHHATGV